MGKRQNTFYIALIFLACQIFGLFVVNHYRSNPLPFGMETLPDEGVLSLTKFVGMLVLITIIILIIIKLKKPQIWKTVYFMGTTAAITVSLYAFVQEYALLIALIISWIKLNESDDFWHNISEILIYGGAIAVITPMFNPLTTILLLGFISFYDIYSVNYSKHMIKMAKTQSQTGVFPGIVINKNKKDQSVLGGGDVAFPLLFASTFILTPITSLLIALGAFAGLVIMLLQTEKGKYYPAMPVLTISSIIGYLISLFIIF
ncbi:MAG: hypothetical protein GON13_00445 [Nanoarchaeota archaeon]|nr:hypothetical protein [Nanoarchaeota archaeon]